MSTFSTPDFLRPSRRIGVIALLIVAAFIVCFAYDRLIARPTRQRVIQRYDEFRAVVATGDAQRILELVAPEFRDWAVSRLHLYQTFATPLDNRSAVLVFLREASICPKPESHYFVIPGGHSVEMVEHNGEWFMGRVSID